MLLAKKKDENLILLNLQINFKNSKTQVILIKSFEEIGLFLKKNLISDEIVIGMGAGFISKHIRELKNII